METNSIICGDNLTVMGEWPEGCIDAIVTDPPYGLEFMGKDWDHGVPGELYWSQMLRVAKPGAHLLAFGGTRTHHRLMCAIEDAGWEIRDCVMWIYGSGFPKSLDVSKAIDKAAGAKRERGPKKVSVDGTVAHQEGHHEAWTRPFQQDDDWQGLYESAPATDAAKQWNGWGTALKPAWEPIVVARKPLEGTVAANVLEHGTGALNIDGCRIESSDDLSNHITESVAKVGYNSGFKTVLTGGKGGRFPANVIHDGSEEVLERFPNASMPCGTPKKTMHDTGMFGIGQPGQIFKDDGSAARFFYTAKASKADRTFGNDHPTVKPVDLMRYLVRLVCPVGGLVLDPFNGSGATTYAAREEQCRYLGIDLDEGYCKIARKRMQQQLLEFGA